MAARADDGAWHPTVAGLLLGSDRAHDFIPGAFIQAVAYRGTSIDPDANPLYQRDAQDITGALPSQIRQACGFVRNNMRVAAYKHKEGGRVDVPQFSMRAGLRSLHQRGGPTETTRFRGPRFGCVSSKIA